ncbi:ER membrane protein complex subunit 4-like [Saccoglossus kowalevskii]
MDHSISNMAFSGVVSRGRRHKWTIDFTSRSRGDKQLLQQSQTEQLPAPFGYSDRQLQDISTQDGDQSLVVKVSGNHCFMLCSENHK